MITCANTNIHLDKKTYAGKTKVFVNQNENNNLLENFEINIPSETENSFEPKNIELFEETFFELHFDHKRSLTSIVKIVLVIIIIFVTAFSIYKLSFCIKDKIRCFKTSCDCFKSDSVYEVKDSSRSRPASFDEVIYDTVSL